MTNDCPQNGIVGCPYCRNTTQHDRNKCPFFAEVNESFKQKQSNRRKIIYQHAVASSSQEDVQQQLPANSMRPQVSNVTHFPPLNNRFHILHSEEVDDESESENPAGPDLFHKSVLAERHRNPYAKIVKEGKRPIATPRSGSKRRKTDMTPSSTISQEVAGHSTRSKSAELRSSARRASAAAGPSHAVHSSRSVDSSNSALSSTILSCARQSGCSAIVIMLLEAFLEPILSAIMPLLPSLLGSLVQGFPFSQQNNG